MAVAAIAVGNLTSPALYVTSFHVEVFSDSGYTELVGSKSCAAVKDSTGNNWIQSDLIGFNGLVRGQTYYIQAGPVSPGGVATFNRYSIQAGTITIPACTYAGTFTATTSGITYDITPANVPSDIDHFEAIWTKDGSAPSNDSLDNAWEGKALANGLVHLFVGGAPGQTIHLFFRAVSISGGYQNWFAVDNRTISAAGGGSGSTNASGITYADGQTVESLKPGQAGADVTGSNTAADTAAVNGINSGHVADTATSVGFLGKWWRTSSSNMFPPNGGELPYTPLVITHDAQINYDIWHEYSWTNASPLPALPSGDGSWLYVRWVGYYFCSTTGTYTFGTNSDDGANLFVNGQALVSELAARHGAQPNLTYMHSGTINLTAGQTYQVIVEYHQEDNNGGIQVLMTPPGGTVQLLNVGAAFTNAAYAQYADGTPVNALQPAAAGADVTAVNVSADTSAVGGRAAADVAQTVLSGGGTDYLHSGNINQPQNGNNLLIRGSFEDGQLGSWSTFGAASVVPVTGQPFTKALSTWSRDTVEATNYFPVSAGQRIYVSCDINTMGIAAGGPVCSIGLFVRDGNQSVFAFPAVSFVAAQTNWEALSGYITIPTGGVTAAAWISIQSFNLAPTQFVQVANMFYSKSPAVDFSDPIHTNKNANNIPYANGQTIQSLQPAQVGADVTGQNTANNTNNVAGVSASTIASVVPSGFKLFINSGNRSYSIQAI